MNYAILLIPFFLGLAPGIYLARAGKALSLVAFLAFVAGITVWAGFDARGGEGAAGMLGAFIVQMLSPVVIGLSTGGLIGVYLARKAGHMPRDDKSRAAEPI